MERPIAKLKQFGLLGGAHIFQLLSSLVGTILVFRYLPLGDVGTVISVVALNGVLAAPVANSFAKIYSSILADNVPEENAAHFYRSALFWLILPALSLAAACYVFFSDVFYAAAGFCLAMLMIHKLNLRYAEDVSEFRRIAATRILAGVIVLTTKVLAVYFEAPYVFAASFVIEFLVYMMALPFPGAGHRPVEQGHGLTVETGTGHHLRAAMKLMPTEFAASLSQRYPIILFSILTLPEAAAMFNAATRLPGAFNSFIMALFAAVRPKAYRQCGSTEPPQFPFGSTVNFFQKAFWMTVVAMIVAPFALPVIFGEAYAPVRYGASLYFLTSIAILMGMIQEIWLITSGNFKISAYRVFIGAAVSVCAVTPLFFLIGLEGAILGVVIAVSVQAMFANGLFKVTRPILAAQFKLLRSALWLGGKS